MSQPDFDSQLVNRLTEIAERLDGGDELAEAFLVKEFNQLAGTHLEFSEFQGIYGGENHANFVQRVLTKHATEASPGLDRSILIEMFAKVLADPRDDAYLQYVFTTIEKTLGDCQVSDLIFWPGEYLGDGNNQRQLTPEVMADAVLERHAQRRSR